MMIYEKAKILIRLILCGAVFFLISLNALAQTPKDVENQIFEEVQRSGGEDAYSSLVAFKSHVESQGESMAHKLCEGYRRVTGMGPKKGQANYQYTFNESMGAWLYMAKKGAQDAYGHSLSGMFFGAVLGNASADMKREFEENKKAQGQSVNNFESLARSIYALVLTNSVSFNQGLDSCLGDLVIGSVKFDNAKAGFKKLLVGFEYTVWVLGLAVSIAADSAFILYTFRLLKFLVGFSPWLTEWFASVGARLMWLVKKIFSPVGIMGGVVPSLAAGMAYLSDNQMKKLWNLQEFARYDVVTGNFTSDIDPIKENAFHKLVEYNGLLLMLSSGENSEGGQTEHQIDEELSKWVSKNLTTEELIRMKKDRNQYFQATVELKKAPVHYKDFLHYVLPLVLDSYCDSNSNDSDEVDQFLCLSS